MCYALHKYVYHIHSSHVSFCYPDHFVYRLRQTTTAVFQWHGRRWINSHPCPCHHSCGFNELPSHKYGAAPCNPFLLRSFLFAMACFALHGCAPPLRLCHQSPQLCLATKRCCRPQQTTALVRAISVSFTLSPTTNPCLRTSPVWVLLCALTSLPCISLSIIGLVEEGYFMTTTAKLSWTFNWADVIVRAGILVSNGESNMSALAAAAGESICHPPCLT